MGGRILPIAHRPWPMAFPPLAYSLLPIACSCVVLALTFWGGLQLDLPLARFLRSVHLPWVELAGDVGSRLGSGAVLAGISGALLAIGLVSKQPQFRRAGLESLIAHAAVALTTQALKHLIGRPRPRMTHGGGFQFGPSWDTGLDSFPSGHAAASFAVAAVLARRFPRAGWFLYGAASVVALSRVMRGSHFPTDVLAGVGLGLVAGYVVANPIRAWRSSLVDALNDMVPYLVGAFALLWTAVHTYPDELAQRVMVAVGGSGMAIGVGSRLYQKVWARDTELEASGSSSDFSHRFALHTSRLPAANTLILIGLALTTGWLLVTALAMLVSIAQWLGKHRADSPPDFRDSRATFKEMAFAVGLIVAVVMIQGLKGILPLL